MLSPEQMNISDLSPAELRIVLLLRTLRPYERIEIKLSDNEPGNVSIIVFSTLKEVFPLDNS